MADSFRVPISDPPALAALRARLPLQSAADVDPRGDLLPTGDRSLDAALGGGLARRRTHLLTGTRGSGAASLLHLLLAAVTPTAPVLLLDPHHRFFPPAAFAAGTHLPHLLLVRETDRHRVERTVAAAVRAGAFPLVVWDAGTLPPLPLIDRLRPLIRIGGSAFLLVTGDHAPATTPADGATLAVSHARWEHRFGVAADPVGDSFMVEEGTLFVKAFYLPKRVIAAVGEDGVHLGISQGEAESLGRQEPPGESNPWLHEPTPDEPAAAP